MHTLPATSGDTAYLLKRPWHFVMALSSFMQTSQTGNMQRLIASSLPVASAYFNRALHGSSVFHMGVGQHQNDPDVLHKEKLKHLSGGDLAVSCLIYAGATCCP